MPTAIIYRPECNSNYTALPNQIFNFGHYSELKARDVAVLTYLLSKPAKWSINRAAIAEAVNMCERTVGTALTVLQKLGFAGHKRFRTGKTEWFVKLPEKMLATSHKANSPIEKTAPSKSCSVLENNDLSETNQETTNVVVETVKVEESHELAVELPEVINVEAVKNDLKTLNAPAQMLVFTVWSSALAKGSLKNPIGAVRHFVKLAKQGTLAAPIENKPTKPSPTYSERYQSEQASIQEKHQKQRFLKLKSMMDEIKQKIGDAAHVVVRGEIVLRVELVQLGLLTA